ncbi:hypothetical protein KDRO_B03810 [Kluyveromyces lactis]|nr:hypothetical protein KDRO_B03810 [Kluyveromyces lactis]
MRTQCVGTTQKGSQCRLKAIEGEKFCRHHSTQDNGTSIATKTPHMPQDAPECVGTTRKGSQCKLKAIEGEKFCRHHINQNNGTSIPTKTPYIPQDTPEYIYIYTYATLHENAVVEKKNRKEITWLVTDNSKMEPSKNRALILHNNRFDPWQHNKDEILIKIGMTRRSDVSKRIDEWQKQCKRDIILITPEIVRQWIVSSTTKPKSINSMSNFIQKLRRLALNNHSNTVKHTTVASTTTVTDTDRSRNNTDRCFTENGFRCKDSGHVEREIHEWLWKEYGKGNIICGACQKTHREWVKVPIGRMEYIVNTVDRICSDSFSLKRT